MALSASVIEDNEIGYFRVYATPPAGIRREITFFRGVPIVVTSMTTQDPFTDGALQISAPQITAWDAFGSGDLEWLVPYADIDVIWENAPGYTYDWRFEGFIASTSISADASGSGVTLDVKGALFLLDNYLAAPTFPPQPIPYELLMEEAFSQEDHPAHLGPFAIEWPSDVTGNEATTYNSSGPSGTGWDRRVPASGKPYDTAFRYAYLRPWGVVPGQLWTGFTTRSTGGWENVLSGFVQGLLSVMFEEGGDQWSIRKDYGRKPVLYLRRIPASTDPKILEVELGAPGIAIGFSRDFTQHANTIFGEGSDTAGTTFSKARVLPNGQFTSYEPFAAQASVWPVQETSPHRNPNIMPKEAQIKFPAGMDMIDAEALARAQINRFADPGFTGTITLTTDARLPDGTSFPRWLIKAGRSIRVKGMFNRPEGVVFHVTESAVDMTGGTVTLTVDSKYRDQLTVAEVRARTRDALTPLRSLQVGKYTNTVQDLLLPWSYAQGSGIIPSGGALRANDFFLKHLPDEAQFPYEEFTKKHPPRAAASRKYYIKIGKTDKKNSNNNWSAAARNGQKALAIPIKMGQQGSIRLLQLAAYRADGSIFPVKFHASIYATNGVSVMDMPRLQGSGSTISGRHLPFPSGATYKPGQRHPFFETAWETVNENGEQYQDISDRYPESAGLVVGYGNYFEPAGYWPGRFSRGDARTGMLVDETQWSWDLTQTLDPQSKKNTAKIAEAGWLYIMIYCEDQGNEDVYFMGRAFRVEPGVQ